MPVLASIHINAVSYDLSECKELGEKVCVNRVVQATGMTHFIHQKKNFS